MTQSVSRVFSEWLLHGRMGGGAPIRTGVAPSHTSTASVLASSILFAASSAVVVAARTSAFGGSSADTARVRFSEAPFGALFGPRPPRPAAGSTLAEGRSASTASSAAVRYVEATDAREESWRSRAADCSLAAASSRRSRISA